MGYTHYWDRRPEIDEETFKLFAADCKKVVNFGITNLGLKLAGPCGEGAPKINDETVSFNGAVDCGHSKDEVGLVWPTIGAWGGFDGSVETALKGEEWFAGPQAEARVCGGDCSYESAIFNRVHTGTPDDDGFCFEFCKTNYRPYDILVQAVCIVLKQHLKNEAKISSDGTDGDWEEASQFCQHALGYGLDFMLCKD